jgi:putative phosphoribosyl transferase
MPVYYGWIDEDELSLVLEESPVVIQAGEAHLEAYLALPGGARELVLVADASTCSRDCREMRYMAEALQELGMATLMVDLLAEDDVQPGHSISTTLPILIERLAAVVEWLQANPQTASLRLGYLGQRAAASAALALEAERPSVFAAIVAQNGQLESFHARLSSIEAATLLIVGESDQAALEANQLARTQLKGERQLAVIPGSGDVVFETQALPHVSRLARGWFSLHLSR